MSNPALSKHPALHGKTLTAEELRRIYEQPAASKPTPADAATDSHEQRIASGAAEAMTYQNTLSKTVFLFLLVIVGGAVGWAIPALLLPGAVIGLALALVNIFKKQPSPPLIIGYALAEGVFLGAISGIYNALLPGIVTQAVFGTFSVFAVTLLLFRSGKVRTSPKLTKIFFIAMIGYLLFSLVNLVLMTTGASTDPWGLRTGIVVFGMPLGLILGVFVVLLAAYSLVMDFELIKNGVDNRVPEKWGWSAAFGLMVTLIWLYLEILRLLAIFASSRN